MFQFVLVTLFVIKFSRLFVSFKTVPESSPKFSQKHRSEPDPTYNCGQRSPIVTPLFLNSRKLNW